MKKALCALLMALLCIGMLPTALANDADVVTIKGITMGTEPAAGLDYFYEALDALTIPDFGAIFRFDYIAWGEETTKIPLAIASNEYDLYVGGPWSNFSDYAAKNAFLDMKPLLDDYPALRDHYGETLLTAMEIGGGIYGMPQLSTMGGGDGFFYRTDVLEAWGIPEVTDLETMEQYLYKAKDAYPSVAMINDNRIAKTFLFGMLTDGKYYSLSDYAAVSLEDPSTVLNRFELPEYKQVLELTQKWYADGIIDHDILAASGNATNETLELMKADKKPLEASNHVNAITNNYIQSLKEVNADWTFSFMPYVQFAYLPSVNTTVQSININSQHAGICMGFIEKFRTDRTYYDLLSYGVLDVNYHLVGEDVSYEGIDAAYRKTGWTGNGDRIMGRLTLIPYPDWAAFVEDWTKLNTETAEQNGFSPVEGFSFDSSDLSAETSNMETVYTQYILPLECGVTSDIDADLERVQSELERAGLTEYLAAMQAQWDAFNAEK